MNDVQIGNICFCRKDYLGEWSIWLSIQRHICQTIDDKTIDVAIRHICSVEYLIKYDVLHRAQTHPNITIDYGSDYNVEFE